MNKPSDHYERCVAEAAKHHASSKTYSGLFLRPHAAFVKEIIDRLGCTSILDYGAGKGQQYEWVMPRHGQTLEQYWGIEVVKYDPAWPPYAKDPVGKFDLVLCTHTMGAIPKTDLPWVVDRLYSLSGKAIYIAEKIGKVKKQVFSQPDLMPRLWTADNWATIIERKTDLEVTLSTRTRDEDGGVLEHRRLISPGHWEPVCWPAGLRPMDASWA